MQLVGCKTAKISKGLKETVGALLIRASVIQTPSESKGLLCHLCLRKAESPRKPFQFLNEIQFVAPWILTRAAIFTSLYSGQSHYCLLHKQCDKPLLICLLCDTVRAAL